MRLRWLCCWCGLLWLWIAASIPSSFSTEAHAEQSPWLSGHFGLSRGTLQDVRTRRSGSALLPDCQGFCPGKQQPCACHHPGQAGSPAAPSSSPAHAGLCTSDPKPGGGDVHPCCWRQPRAHPCHLLLLRALLSISPPSRHITSEPTLSWAVSTSLLPAKQACSWPASLLLICSIPPLPPLPGSPAARTSEAATTRPSTSLLVHSQTSPTVLTAVMQGLHTHENWFELFPALFTSSLLAPPDLFLPLQKCLGFLLSLNTDCIRTQGMSFDYIRPKL